MTKKRRTRPAGGRSGRISYPGISSPGAGAAAGAGALSTAASAPATGTAGAGAGAAGGAAGGAGKAAGPRMARAASAVAAVLLVAPHPVERGDRRGQRDLAREHHAGDDLGELLDLALALAAQDLQALALGGEAGAAAVGCGDSPLEGDH